MSFAEEVTKKQAARLAEHGASLAFCQRSTCDVTVELDEWGPTAGGPCNKLRVKIIAMIL